MRRVGKWTSFTKDPQVILGARRGIDELIAKMQDAGPNP